MTNLAPQSHAEEERQLRAAMAASQVQAFDIRFVTQERHRGAGASATSWEAPPIRQLVADPRCLGTSGLLGCGALLAILLLSMAVVHPTEFGLRFNRFSLEIDREHYPPGRHIIGPMSSMLIYPATVQTLEFSSRASAIAAPLRTRTDEGLDLTVHIAFQYKLKPDSLYNLYMLYRDDYRIVFERKATSLLLQVASTYEAEKYWTERPVIGEAMLQGLRNLFQAEADVTGLELFVMDLPANFEDKIVQTQVQRQIKRTRESEQGAAVIRAEIEVMLADFARSQQITLNAATANATLLTKTAEANAQRRRIDVETEAMRGVKTKIGLSSAGLVNYQRGIAYQSLEEAQFMFGVPQAAAIVSVSERGAVVAKAAECQSVLAV